MTQNQLAYQANKIKADEAATKALEAETHAKKAASDIELDRSKHIHEYKDIYKKPSDNPDWMGTSTWKDTAKGWKDIFGSAKDFWSSVTGMGALFK